MRQRSHACSLCSVSELRQGLPPALLWRCKPEAPSHRAAFAASCCWTQGTATLQALGIKPRQIKQPSLPKLGQQDLAQLLQRNPSGENEGAEDPEAKRLADADRMKGLGYLP